MAQTVFKSIKGVISAVLEEITVQLHTDLDPTNSRLPNR